MTAAIQTQIEAYVAKTQSHRSDKTRARSIAKLAGGAELLGMTAEDFEIIGTQIGDPVQVLGAFFIKQSMNRHPDVFNAFLKERENFKNRPEDAAENVKSLVIGRAC